MDSAVSLSNGVQLPWLGLGTYRGTGPEIERAVREAVDLGYRNIDTASIYDNEASVGKALRECGLPRQELFLTTKVWNSEQGYESTLRAYDASLKRLGVDYVDLYLVHWPVPGKSVPTWRALEKLYAEARVRAIGVSNFLVHHLQELLESAEVAPMVNQIEFHPHLVQPELLRFCQAQDLRPQAWSPILRGRVLELPELADIGRRHGKSPVQVTLRWDLQHGVCTIPKSVHRHRLASNADIFDFELSDQEMARIDALDQGSRSGPDPDVFPRSSSI